MSHLCRQTLSNIGSSTWFNLIEFHVLSGLGEENPLCIFFLLIFGSIQALAYLEWQIPLLHLVSCAVCSSDTFYMAQTTTAQNVSVALKKDCSHVTTRLLHDLPSHSLDGVILKKSVSSGYKE